MKPRIHSTSVMRAAFVSQGIALMVLLLALAGCGPSNVQVQENLSAGGLPRPDTILIYDFAVSPEEVNLDTGLSAELKQYYSAHQGETRTAQELKIGHMVANDVADELVKKIKSYGLWAERAFGKVEPKGKTLLVKGQFISIDEGNRTERVAIGFGLGRTSVQANVQIYEMTSRGEKEVESMEASSKSGYKPGMAEMMGLGALTGHLLASTLISGTVSAAGEMSFETVQSDGKTLGDKVAANLGQFFIEQGWIPPEAVKSPIL